MNPFAAHLLQALRRHLESDACRYADNSAAYYAAQSPKAMREDKDWLRATRIPTAAQFCRANQAAIVSQITAKAGLYDLLRDAHSRNILVLTALYALLGHRLVKFPYYGPDNISQRSELARRHACQSPPPGMRPVLEAHEFDQGCPLRLYAFSYGGMRIMLYATAEFLYTLFCNNTYRYAHGSVCIDVERGDCVLDCGACYGDTALMFALKTGPRGRVLSFEPHPLLSVLWKYNVGLNPELAPRLELLKKGVGEAQAEAAFVLNGPGSHREGTFGQWKGSAKIAITTIDQTVREHGLRKVDFIKMDVEGAELSALRGAEETIGKFRPKLAVCVYHKPEDYVAIPSFIHNLGLGYSFYLEHHYVNEWETVLYARV